MRKLILVLTIVAGPVQAFDWPWQKADQKDYGYCKGFIHAGLAAFPVKDLSRTQLWLSWSEVTREEFAVGGLSAEQYEAGISQFDSLLASSDTAALVEVANGECDFADI